MASNTSATTATTGAAAILQDASPGNDADSGRNQADHNGADLDLLRLGRHGLPGPQFRPLCGGSFCFTAIDPAWGGGYVFFNRRKKDGEWKLVTDELMIELLKAGVPATATAAPRICAALRAGNVELDVGVAARALSFLDCVSLTRTEAVNKSFCHDISRIAWNGLANKLSREVKDRAKKKWKKVQDGETIQHAAKDMVIYAQKEKIASEYAEEIANMSPEEFAKKGQLLSELYPSREDYDVYIRFSSGERVLCTGFFEVTKDITILNEVGADGDKGTISTDDADLSLWPEMKAYVEAFAAEDEIRVDLFDRMDPDHIETVVFIHKRSLRPFVFFRNQLYECAIYGNMTSISVDLETIISSMMFDAYHEGEFDLDAEIDVNGPSGDFRRFVEGNLSLQPSNNRHPKQVGWNRDCNLEFDRPGMWKVVLSDERA